MFAQHPLPCLLVQSPSLSLETLLSAVAPCRVQDGLAPHQAPEVGCSSNLVTEDTASSGHCHWFSLGPMSKPMRGNLGPSSGLWETGEDALLVSISNVYNILGVFARRGDCHLVPCAHVCLTTGPDDLPRGRTIWLLKVCSEAGLPAHIFSL